jgi:hypothetical protein
VLNDIEFAWGLGHAYLIDVSSLANLQACSSIIQENAARYPKIKDSLDCKDADLFILIPCLILLRYLSSSLPYQLSSKKLITTYFPTIHLQKLKSLHFILISKLTHSIKHTLIPSP